MLVRHITWVTVSNLINRINTELVFCALREPCHNVIGVWQVLWQIASDPVFCIGSLHFNKITDNRASAIIGWFGPRQAYGTAGGVNHFWECWWARRI